jgi:hypothetical protein
MDYKRSFSLLAAAGVIALAPLARAEGHGYLQHNLVSDNPAAAAADNTDPNLLNPWGVAFFPGSPFWISDNGAGVSTLYDGTGAKIPLTVTIPAPAGDTNAGAPGPSGMIWNGNPMAFPVGNNAQNTAPALFIWATEDGTIAAWQGGLSPITEAVTVVPHPAFVIGGTGTDPVYKGLAIGNNSSGLFLYASNFRDGKIAVWDRPFLLVPLLPPHSARNLPISRYRTDSPRLASRTSVASSGSPMRNRTPRSMIPFPARASWTFSTPTVICLGVLREAACWMRHGA